MNKVILVVEDERIVARDLRESLMALGYDVPDTAASATEALRLASERRPDLVLMDIHIEGPLDGIDAGQLLRREFDVPVVFLTAHSDGETVARAKRAQPYGYLVKPVQEAALRTTLEVALHKHAADRELRERAEWLSTTLHSIGDAVIAADVGGRVTFMNPVAEKLTGWRAEDAQGRALDEVLQLRSEPGGPPAEQPIHRAMRERRSAGLADDLWLVAKDGDQRPIAEVASPLVERGHTSGAVMVFRDVSEERRAMLRVEIADRVSSLGTLAAGVAHEVNNPLAAILGNLEYTIAMLSEPGEAGDPRAPVSEVGEALRESLAAAHRIREVVERLRRFTDAPKQRASATELRELVDAAVRSTSTAHQGRATIVREVAEGLFVDAPESQVGQIIANLVTNAAQAIPPGDAERNQICIRARATQGDRIVIEVADTGSGIPPDIAKHIFDPFFTTKPQGEGAGLGLSICRGIVNGLGGEVDLETEVGQGSTFRLTLPASPKPTTPRAASDPPPSTQ